MDGYKRFTRVEKIKFLLDNSYIKGSAKEYLNSKFYNEGNIFSQYVSESIDKTINYVDYLRGNLYTYTEYVAEQNFIQKKV